ncbi:MAG: SoxR reducing system RseC family protein [Spirochaetales bacterium]|uniref:SoxR reducing system RseC family protein n=1 Tax=Candidatus Thalassospirochaeta sargassi TaxID=3119039 RepID=A0AAJ1IDW5_9SPIO|nr:SoxR reducing system RseC family protein [Spirochaetales bacterium]
MLEKATVVNVKNKIITLACGDSEGCSSCAAHGFCGGVSDKTFEAWNANSFELERGDSVEVLLPTGKTIGSAFMVMIFPLLLFFLGFYAVKLIDASSGEGLQVLGGLAGIAAGFGINFLLNRKPAKKNMPEIIRKL